MTFTIVGPYDPSQVIVYGTLTGTGQTTTVKPVSVDGGQVVVKITSDGSYAVAEKIELPCAEKSVTAELNAASNADLAQLAGVTTLTGNLAISGSVTDLKDLKCLTFLTGYLSISSAPNLVQAELPELREANRIYVNSNAKQTVLSLPKLRSVASGDGYSVALNALPELTAVRLGQLVAAPSSINLSNLSESANSPLTLDFESLTEIRGNLDVNTVSELESTDGFPNLRLVVGYTSLYRVADLKTARLPALTETNRVAIHEDALLTSIDLSALVEVASGDGFSFYLNVLPELTSIKAPALPQMPSSLNMSNLSESANAALTLDFGSLTEIRGNLDLNTVSKLESTDGFPKLALVVGYVSLYRVADLKTARLPALTETNRVAIHEDALLTSIDLSALVEVASGDGFSLYLNVLPELTSIKAPALPQMPSSLNMSNLSTNANTALTLDFGSLTEIRGNLDINTVSKLETTDGFPKLALVVGYVSLYRVADLKTARFPALTETNRVAIHEDALLTSIDLSALVEVASGDGYSFYLNVLPKLTSIKAPGLTQMPASLNMSNLSAGANAALTLDFGSLAEIGGNLDINTVSKLESTDGFPKLALVVGYVSLYRMADLKTARFPKLTQIRASLAISENTTLESMNFSALTALDGDLQITSNPLLPTCAAKDFGNRVKPVGSDGTATISGNKPDAC